MHSLARFIAVAVTLQATATCRDSHVLTGYRSPVGVNGTQRRGPHSGVDFDGETGDDVIASADGVVADAVTSEGAGTCVLVRHTCDECSIATYFTSYCHLQSALVHTGRIVLRGQKIGTVGATGRKSGDVPHVHLSLCTYACSTGTSDGNLTGTLDPMAFDAGCFVPGRDYAAPGKLVITHPIACKGR